MQDENKDKQAKNAETTRGNRKREVIALYSLVIRKAEKGNFDTRYFK